MNNYFEESKGESIEVESDSGGLGRSRHDLPV